MPDDLTLLTVDELRDRLTNQRERLYMCDFIDSYESYHRCRETNLDRIHRLEDEIAKREAAASVLWPPSGNAEAADVSD
jgi:uncharacterized small protein (DUF1192 family)